MKVFNLAEELEKERKKNKELEERNEVLEKGCKEYRYHIKQMNKIHDNCLNTIEELKDKIDSSIEYIKEHSTTIDYKTMKADYNLNMNDLLDILKGE